jgi:hypothetical protein
MLLLVHIQKNPIAWQVQQECQKWFEVFLGGCTTGLINTHISHHPLCLQSPNQHSSYECILETNIYCKISYKMTNTDRQLALWSALSYSRKQQNLPYDGNWRLTPYPAPLDVLVHLPLSETNFLPIAEISSMGEVWMFPGTINFRIFPVTILTDQVLIWFKLDVVVILTMSSVGIFLYHPGLSALQCVN